MLAKGGFGIWHASEPCMVLDSVKKNMQFFAVGSAPPKVYLAVCLPLAGVFPATHSTGRLAAFSWSRTRA